MIPGLFLIVISAAGGAFLYDAYLKSKQNSAFDNVARKLETGKTYAVQLMVNPKDPGWTGITDREAASENIKSTFETLGWKIGSPPLLRNEDEAKKFFAGEPDQWLFTGTWTKAEMIQVAAPTWATMTLPYLLP